MPLVSRPQSYDDRLADTLVRRRYDARIKPLSTVLSFDDLIDAPFCRSLTEELALGDRAWEVHLATPDLWQQLPESPGLYMFVLTPQLRLRRAHPQGFSMLPRTLYVGKAGSTDGNGSLKARYRSEYQHYVCRDPERLWEEIVVSDRKALMRKYLNVAPLHYWYLEIAERDTIRRLETSLIKLLNPPLNSQGVTKMRISPPVPAF
jgi:hypothetical protein